jgi:hypothetical protein
MPGKKGRALEGGKRGSTWGTSLCLCLRIPGPMNCFDLSSNTFCTPIISKT